MIRNIDILQRIEIYMQKKNTTTEPSSTNLVVTAIQILKKATKP